MRFPCLCFLTDNAKTYSKIFFGLWAESALYCTPFGYPNIMQKNLFFVLAFSLLLPLFGQPLVVENFRDLTGWKSNRDSVQFAATAGPDEHPGLQVTLPGMLSKDIGSQFDPGREKWNDYQGISFYVKGDGSEVWSNISIGMSSSFTYAYFFPLKSTDWVKYTVPWNAFSTLGLGDPIGSLSGLPPCGITTLTWGNRWNLTFNSAAMPSHTYAVAQVMLEPVVAPLPPPPAPAPFSKFLGKLKARQPVVIQCQGDSITAGAALRDKETQRYAVVLGDILRNWLKYEDIYSHSRGVGGARINDCVAWVARDLCEVPEPDLITILIGYNDKSGACPQQVFRARLSDYIDRLCRQTQGRSSILLIATGPGTGARWFMQDDYAQVARELAQERSLPCFDLNKIVKTELGQEKYSEYMADIAHPNQAGHRFIADKLADFLIAQADIDAPKPPTPATDSPAVPPPPGKAWHWDFEESTGWSLNNAAEFTRQQCKSGQMAVKLSMAEGARDYSRAWGPLFPVQPGQRYRVQVEVLNCLREKGYRVYICTYNTADGSGPYELFACFSDLGNSSIWMRPEGKVKIPATAQSAKVLLWLNMSARGDVYFDDLAVLPE
jgi:lysophospholipase L1-like esterase